MSNELKFASESEALQHLSDITGNRIKIAYEQHEFESVIYINQDNDEEEIEVDVSFSYSPPEKKEEFYPGSPEEVEISEIKTKDGKTIDLDVFVKEGKLTEAEKKSLEDELEEGAFDAIKDKQEASEEAKAESILEDREMRINNLGE
jgi:hypothetical protein